MKCVVICDTHGMYPDLKIPPGDVFIHAGDILGRGKLPELVEFNAWLSTLPHTHKIVIASNHSWSCYWYFGSDNGWFQCGLRGADESN